MTEDKIHRMACIIEPWHTIDGIDDMLRQLFSGKHPISIVNEGNTYEFSPRGMSFWIEYPERDEKAVIHAVLEAGIRVDVTAMVEWVNQRFEEAEE